MRKRKDPEPSGEILRSRAERKRSRLDIASKADMARAGRGEHSRCREKKKTVIKRKKRVSWKEGSGEARWAWKCITSTGE